MQVKRSVPLKDPLTKVGELTAPFQKLQNWNSSSAFSNREDRDGVERRKLRSNIYFSKVLGCFGYTGLATFV